MPRRQRYRPWLVPLDLRQRWTQEQQDIKSSIKKEDDTYWEIPSRDAARSHFDYIGEDTTLDLTTLRYIGGTDISFTKGSNENACASLVILSWPSLEVVYESHNRVTMTQPYVAGFLAFREIEHLIQLIEKMRRERPELEPDVVFVDGNGILHPRGVGIASHFGVVCNLRTIGIGKTFLDADGLHKSRVQSINRNLPPEAHGEFKLIGNSGLELGVALRIHEGVKNPIFVSIGHRVSLSTCTKLTKMCSVFRVPEPIRKADSISRSIIREWHADS